MNQLQVFKHSQFGEMRTIISDNNEPLFCLTDLCNILEIKNVADCVSRLTPKGIVKADTPTNGGIQKLNYVNESNFYKVIFRSRKAEAEIFTEWVTSEVLPSIRKTGGYLISKIHDTPETIMARAILVAKETMERQQKQLEMANKQLQHQAPVVQYANKVLLSTSGHTSTTIASELNMSAITLNRLLVKARFLRKTGKKGEYSITATYQGKGYVKPNTQDYERPDGSIGTRIGLEFTEKGRIKIHEIFNRAISAGVVVEKKGRFFINYEWESPKEEESCTK